MKHIHIILFALCSLCCITPLEAARLLEILLTRLLFKDEYQELLYLSKIRMRG
ncbi:hypothetical protein [uncultured Parabacteroides sp.]|uniref:hypothetical protein n=1 Tax=uncultured Parabacteroides sp. TaxID=512312 RepID=UPI00189C0AAC|nr:hypothetical protein [uncultured Parabacteroides sp.]